MHDDPDYLQFAKDVCRKRGEPIPKPQKYHRAHSYGRVGGTLRLYLCGPVREETEQEYFVRWASGDV